MYQKGDLVRAPVMTKGDRYRWMDGEVEKVLGRKVFVRYQCGDQRLLGCWFPEDLRRRSE